MMYLNPILGPTYTPCSFILPSQNLGTSLMLSHEKLSAPPTHSSSPSLLPNTVTTQTSSLSLPIMQMHQNYHRHVNRHLCSCSRWVAAYWRLQPPRRLTVMNTREGRLSADHQTAIFFMQHQDISSVSCRDHRDHFCHIITWFCKKYPRVFDCSNLCCDC